MCVHIHQMNIGHHLKREGKDNYWPNFFPVNVTKMLDHLRAVFAVLLILVAIEAHQDKMLNDIAAKNNSMDKNN